MGKIIQIEVSEDIPEDKIKKWILEGISREITRKLVLDVLREGMELNEDELKKFESTREEVWLEVKERYKKKGIL